MPTDAERLKANLQTLSSCVDARAREQVRVNQATVRRLQAQGARIGALDDRVTTVEGGLADLSGLVITQGEQQDMLRQAHETTATHVDRHDQQIATHDNWFVAIFERIGDRVDWLMVILMGFLAGLISIPCWYFFVFEQYGFAKHFADPKNQLAVDLPADPGRMWLISIACSVVVMFIVAFVLSFIMKRTQNLTNAQPPANAAANPAPTPTLELPAAPPAAPAPVNAGQRGNAQAAAAQ